MQNPLAISGRSAGPSKLQINIGQRYSNLPSSKSNEVFSPSEAEEESKNKSVPLKQTSEKPLFGGIRNFNAQDDDFKRQSSIASFQNLSIGDFQSACESQASHYCPSVNEHVIPVDATEEEREMHQFLDSTGIFSVNVKDQLKSEKKEACAPSSTRLSLLRGTKKSSPSLLERR